MKARNIILTSICSLLLGILVFLNVWRIWMPYPFGLWLSARDSSKYSNEWVISKSDYDAALQIVHRELRSKEIIINVEIIGTYEIEFMTLEQWSGPLAASGNIFTLTKLPRGWEITSTGLWMS